MEIFQLWKFSKFYGKYPAYPAGYFPTIQHIRYPAGQQKGPSGAPLHELVVRKPDCSLLAFRVILLMFVNKIAGKAGKRRTLDLTMVLVCINFDFEFLG